MVNVEILYVKNKKNYKRIDLGDIDFIKIVGYVLFQPSGNGLIYIVRKNEEKNTELEFGENWIQLTIRNNGI